MICMGFQLYKCNSNFTVNRDQLYKVRKQGWSPTPADILVENLIHQTRLNYRD